MVVKYKGKVPGQWTEKDLLAIFGCNTHTLKSMKFEIAEGAKHHLTDTSTTSGHEWLIDFLEE